MTDVPEGLRVELAAPSAPRCDHTINLHGRVYRCARHPHWQGIHDANAVHPSDDQAVRW